MSFISRFLPHLWFLPCLLLSLPAAADTSDWLQVQRFQQQLEKARGGDTQAMYDVARRYERGRGVDLNMQEAVAWFRKCASAGNPACQARLGILYFSGRGVSQDHRKALELLRPAAKSGIPMAQYQLGLMYQYGTGVSQNRKLAMQWYRRALENGDYRAKAKLAEMRRQPAVPPTRSATRPKSPATADRTREILLAGAWLNGNRPADVLPSAITRCEPRGTEIHCSAERERATDTDIITTRTEAVLKNIGTEGFNIRYSSTVLSVKPKAELTSAPIGDEDEDAAGRTLSAVKVGQKSRARTLKCRLLDDRHIRCEGGLRDREFHLPDA